MAEGAGRRSRPSLPCVLQCSFAYVHAVQACTHPTNSRPLSPTLSLPIGVRALRDIDCDEEIYISYVNPALPWSVRNANLREQVANKTAAHWLVASSRLLRRASSSCTSLPSFRALSVTALTLRRHLDIPPPPFLLPTTLDEHPASCTRSMTSPVNAVVAQGRVCSSCERHGASLLAFTSPWVLRRPLAGTMRYRHVERVSSLPAACPCIGFAEHVEFAHGQDVAGGVSEHIGDGREVSIQ